MNKSKDWFKYQNTVLHRTLQDVADELGVSKTTLFRRLTDMGVNFKINKAWNSGISCYDDSRILSGENHPRWKDKSKYYIEYKMKKKELLGDTQCSLCNNIAVLLHHKDKDTNNNMNENLVPLCRSCHTILHNKERGITRYVFNCAWCGKQKTILNNKKCEAKFCSSSCRAKDYYARGLCAINNNPNVLSDIELEAKIRANSDKNDQYPLI